MALQYSATEGLASVRDYVSGRLESLEGRAPGAGELMITSGGIDCMELVAKSYVDPGDVVVVEAPTYLGGIMAFRGYEADVRGVPVDGGGHARRRARWPAGRRTAAEDPLHDPGLPEPDRAVDERPTGGRSWSRWPAGTGS